jgi:hypothetical protein
VSCDDTLTCTTDVCLLATGACEHLGPDADGDTYVDSTCFGTDCNDAAAGVHPGATESCDGVDDDCDFVPDDGATCATPPNATAQCLGGSCNMTCSPGWDDCDDVRTNGCEASLADPATCGSCTTACAPTPHAVASCTGSGCGIASCDDGWGDCNTLASDGCERALNTLTDCGTCLVACAPANATGSDCADGSCGYADCSAGWLDCDSHPENGCELSAGTATACGTSCATVTNCTTLPHVTSATCTTGACAIAGCVSGYAECNDRPSDGCERLLDNNVGTCAAAEDLGSIRGDQGTDVLTATRFGEGWFAFDVTEAETSSYTELTATIALDVPAGIDYDVYVYCGTTGCTSVGGPSGTNGPGNDETVNVRWNDASGYTNRTVYFEIRFYTGGTLDCGNWTVTITGNTTVGTVTCP